MRSVYCLLFRVYGSLFIVQCLVFMVECSVLPQRSRTPFPSSPLDTALSTSPLSSPRAYDSATLILAAPQRSRSVGFRRTCFLFYSEVSAHTLAKTQRGINLFVERLFEVERFRAHRPVLEEQTCGTEAGSYLRLIDHSA